MLFLGIDQALGHTGLAVIDDAGDLKDLQVIAPGKLRGAPRLAYIWDQVDAALQLYPVKQAALEGYAYDASGRTFDLGEVGGLVRLLLYRRRIPFVVVAPAALKKFVGAGAQASKEQVMAAIARKYGIEIDQNDAADAYGLARVARVYDLGVSTDRNELEVVKALKEPPTKKASPKSRTKISI